MPPMRSSSGLAGYIGPGRCRNLPLLKKIIGHCRRIGRSTTCAVRRHAGSAEASDALLVDYTIEDDDFLLEKEENVDLYDVFLCR